MNRPSTHKGMDTKKRLGQVALRLFAQGGYEATSTRDIATAAGCNISMISHYYGSKEGLLMAILTDFLNAEREELVRIGASDLSPDEQLAAYIDFLVDDFRTRPRAALVIHRDLRTLNSELALGLHQLIAENIRLIGKLIDRANHWSGDHPDPAGLARMLIGMLVFYFSEQRHDIETHTPEQMRELKRFLRSCFLQ